MTDFHLDDYRIAKLEVKPGDIVVVKIDCIIREELRTRIGEYFKPITEKGVKILVIEKGVDLSVLTFDEIQSRAQASPLAGDGTHEPASDALS